MNEDQGRPGEQLRDAQLRTLAYFAIGVASEGSMGGRSVAYRLSFAGSVNNGVMSPVGNSGFSIGTLQTDLGQHPEVATRLVEAYQDWARQQTPSMALSEDAHTRTVHDLQRDGRAIRADGGRALDGTIKANLDRFLASDQGIDFVHGNDRSQVEHLLRTGDGQDRGGAMHQLRQTGLYIDADLDDQARLATMLMKLENQAGRGRYPGVLRAIGDGTLQSVDDVKDRIDAMLPNRVVNGEERPDYIESGIEHALRGTDVFNRLRGADAANPLHAAFEAVSADPLVSPVALRTDPANAKTAHGYDVVKTMFLQNAEAPAFIAALDRGGSHAWGRPQPEGRRRATAGLYASGDDFVVWNREGRGHAYIGGTWSDVSRDELTRTRNTNGTTDLDRTAPDGTTLGLLHVDPGQPALRTARLHGSAAASPRLDRAQGAELAYPLLHQAEDAVRQLNRRLGREYDQDSACMAASAACLARRAGLTGIDHVVLSRGNDRTRDGENIFVVQGDLHDPTHQRAWMRADDAIRTPVAQSLEAFERVSGPEQARVSDDPQQQMQHGMRM